MSDDIPLFRVDKEGMVLDLYRQGKRRREIASIVRMNFSDIKTIIDREFGPKEERKKTAKNTDSVYSQALKHFVKGRKQVEVAIILNLSYEETRRIYLQFLKLNRMHRLGKLYDELGEDGIKPFLLLFDRMQENNFTVEQMEDAVYYTGSLGELKQIHSALEEDIHELELKRDKLVSANQNLENMIKVADRNLQCYNYETEMKKQEFIKVSQEVNIQKNFIQNFDNDEGYIRIKESAQKESRLLIQNKNAFIYIAVVAVLEAIRLYPTNQQLIFHLMTSNSETYRESWMESHKLELVQLTEFVHNDILKIVSKVAVEQLRRINE